MFFLLILNLYYLYTANNILPHYMYMNMENNSKNDGPLRSGVGILVNRLALNV